MTAGIMSQYFARTWKTFIMNGTSSSVSNHSPVKPTDNFSVRNSLRRLLRKFFFVADVGDRAARVRDLLSFPIDQRNDFFIGRFRTQVGRDQRTEVRGQRDR